MKARPSPKHPPKKTSDRDWRAIVVIVVVALAACVAGISNDYTQDDGYLIRDNAVIHDLGNFPQFFSSPFWPPPFSPDLYRPLTSLFLALQYAFGTGEPTIYRLVSYLLYAACGIAVFALARRFLSRNTALVIAALFAAHPVHVEAVALGVAQNELVVGLIAIVLTIRYLDRRRAGELQARDWILLTALYAAACLFKEQGFVIPGLLIAAELFLIEHSEPRQIRSLGPGFSAMIAVGFVLLFVRHLVLGDVGGTFVAEALTGLGFGGRALTMLQVVPQWLRLLVFPAHLQSDYSPQEIVASHTFGGIEMLGAAILGGATAAVWFTRKSSPACAFGIVWCGITLFPVSNLLLPTAILLAERTLFLPSVGALLALGAFVEPVLARAFAERARIAWSAVGAIVLLGVLRSIERERVWRNEAFLAVRTVQDAPRSFRAQRAYGDILFELNQPTLALAAYDRALELAPRDQTWRVRNDLARSFRILDRRSDEAAQLSASLAQQPAQDDTRAYLVAADLALGEYAAAAAQADSAIARGGNPSVFKGLRAVADSAARVGAPAGAVKIAINQGDRMPSR
jgi:hypothetical protein